MKKFFILLALVLVSACAWNVEPQLQNNGKVSYTKEASAVRLFGFGNPSIVDLAKENGIKEVNSVEKDFYIILNKTTIKGN